MTTSMRTRKTDVLSESVSLDTWGGLSFPHFVLSFTDRVRFGEPMTISDKPCMPARYYAGYCAWLKTIGVNVDALLRASHITPAELAGPEAMLHLSQVDELIAQNRSDEHKYELQAQMRS